MVWGRFLVSYCGLSWLQLTAKTFNSFNINHKYTTELGNLFWKQQQQNPKQSALNPSNIAKTLTFIHTQILPQLLKHFFNLLKATKILYHFLVQCKLGFHIDWSPQIFYNLLNLILRFNGKFLFRKLLSYKLLHIWDMGRYTLLKLFSRILHLTLCYESQNTVPKKALTHVSLVQGLLDSFWFTCSRIRQVF